MLSIKLIVELIKFLMSNELYTLGVIAFLLSSSIIAIRYKRKNVSLYCLYSLTVYVSFFLSIKRLGSPIILLSMYCVLTFLSYHILFTFHKKFYNRTTIIVKAYVIHKNYIKLVLWVVLVLTTSLILEPFIFFAVFNPLLVFSLLDSSSGLFFALLLWWVWMILLCIGPKFDVSKGLLAKITLYFSRRACLHYLGSNVGSRYAVKVGYKIFSPLIASIPFVYRFFITTVLFLAILRKFLE